MPPVARGRASAEQGARGPWVWPVPPCMLSRPRGPLPHGHRAPRPGTASLTSQRQKRPRHAPRSPARARGARRPASASGPWPPPPRGVPARAPGPARTFRHGELAGRRLSGPRRDGVRPEPLHRPVLGRLLLRLRSLRAAGVQHRLQDPPPGVDEPGRGADRGAAVTSSRSSGRPQPPRRSTRNAATQTLRSDTRRRGEHSVHGAREAGPAGLAGIHMSKDQLAVPPGFHFGWFGRLWTRWSL